MFGAICNSINDDGQQLKLAHNFANKHNLPVENLTGEYYIKIFVEKTDTGKEGLYLQGDATVTGEPL